jgi:hypothetical protein
VKSPGREIHLLRCSAYITTIDTSPKRKRGTKRVVDEPSLALRASFVRKFKRLPQREAIFFRIDKANFADKLGQRSSLSLLRSSSISDCNR